MVRLNKYRRVILWVLATVQFSICLFLLYGGTAIIVEVLQRSDVKERFFYAQIVVVFMLLRVTIIIHVLKIVSKFLSKILPQLRVLVQLPDD